MCEHPDGRKADARPSAAPTSPAGVISYAAAGVDIAAGERAVEMMRSAVEASFSSAVATRFGTFGAAVRSPGHGMLLVSSADSVGSKVCLVHSDEEAAGLGRDLVHHCINDILTCGARPLFFLDYLAFAHLRPERAATIVRGMAATCAAHGCALVGGETAELPDLYRENAFDIAGFIVGSVPAGGLLDGSTIELGDALVGLPSAGLHTNGYTLARRLLTEQIEDLASPVRDLLLAEHRCYLPELSPLLEDGAIRGMAHITGGGLPGNVPRMLPQQLAAHLDPSSWSVPAIFTRLAAAGPSAEELYRTFNMGIGMVLACAPNRLAGVLDTVPGAQCIGTVTQRVGSERVTGLW